MIHTVISLLVQNSQLQGDTLFSASWRSVGTGTSRIYKFIVAWSMSPYLALNLLINGSFYVWSSQYIHLWFTERLICFLTVFILADWVARVHTLLHQLHRWMTMLRWTSAIMLLLVWVVSNNLSWLRNKFNQVLLPSQLELVMKNSLDHMRFLSLFKTQHFYGPLAKTF